MVSKTIQDYPALIRLRKAATVLQKRAKAPLPFDDSAMVPFGQINQFLNDVKIWHQRLVTAYGYSYQTDNDLEGDWLDNDGKHWIDFAPEESLLAALYPINRKTFVDVSEYHAPKPTDLIGIPPDKFIRTRHREWLGLPPNSYPVTDQRNCDKNDWGFHSREICSSLLRNRRLASDLAEWSLKAVQEYESANLRKIRRHRRKSMYEDVLVAMRDMKQRGLNYASKTAIAAEIDCQKSQLSAKGGQGTKAYTDGMNELGKLPTKLPYHDKEVN
ncbi:hypothetical protein OAU50_04300 [Planctomycetota bacterium]|nr:hypothetical protein [Planctomycetota bacterium]